MIIYLQSLFCLAKINKCFLTTIIVFLFQIVLGRDARKDERNIIEVEASNIEGDLIRYPVACLKLGHQEMVSPVYNNLISYDWSPCYITLISMMLGQN